MPWSWYFPLIIHCFRCVISETNLKAKKLGICDFLPWQMAGNGVSPDQLLNDREIGVSKKRLPIFDQGLVAGDASTIVLLLLGCIVGLKLLLVVV